MNLQIYKSLGTVGKKVIRAVLEDIPGGITLISADLKTATTEVLLGALVEYTESDGTCHLVKTAEVYSTYTAAATTIKVKKNHEFVVGDFISNGLVATAITAIDTTTSTLYDDLTITAALDVEDIAADYVLYQGASETTAGATAATAQVEDVTDATLTMSLPDGTNRVKLIISQNGSDALAVTFTESTKTLAIALASTTATKNTATLIQTAVQALGVVGAFNFSAATFVAAGTWDSAAKGAVLTIPSDYTTAGVAYAECAEKYEANAVTLTNLDNSLATPNLISGAMVRGSVVEAAMYYAVHDKNVASLTDRIKFV